MKSKKRKLVRKHLVREFVFRPCHDGSYKLLHPYPFWKTMYALDYYESSMILKDFENGYTIKRIADHVNRPIRCVSSYICLFYNVMTVWDARKIVKKTNK